MRVNRDWLEAFDVVMNHHRTAFPYTFGDDAVEECKQEARDHEEWAREFYPRAAAMIRETT